jgi:hypothetical protein
MPTMEQVVTTLMAGLVDPPPADGCGEGAKGGKGAKSVPGKGEGKGGDKGGCEDEAVPVQSPFQAFQARTLRGSPYAKRRPRRTVVLAGKGKGKWWDSPSPDDADDDDDEEDNFDDDDEDDDEPAKGKGKRYGKGKPGVHLHVHVYHWNMGIWTGNE